MAQATNRAFADERRAAIMEMLEHNASVQVAEIAQTFGVSSVTARADLDALAETGKLRRTHGGAVSLHKRLTVSTQDRRINVNVAAKQAIAQSAIELVNDGDTLLVDSGTTALEFVRLLDQRDGITVITADITIADYIDESMPSVDVVMLGGGTAQRSSLSVRPTYHAGSPNGPRRSCRHVPWRFCSRLRLYDRLSPDGRDQNSYDRRSPSKRRPHGS